MAARTLQQAYRRKRAVQDHRQDTLVAMAKEIPRALENMVLWKEQQAFDQELDEWALYVDIFRGLCPYQICVIHFPSEASLLEEILKANVGRLIPEAQQL